MKCSAREITLPPPEIPQVGGNVRKVCCATAWPELKPHPRPEAGPLLTGTEPEVRVGRGRQRSVHGRSVSLPDARVKMQSPPGTGHHGDL